MPQGFLISPRTAEDETPYTYRRVLENGDFVLRRVPATGDLPSGSPVFPKRAPEFKAGEGNFNGSSAVDHILKRDRLVITSKQIEDKVFSKALVERLSTYVEKGFAWVIEADPRGGKSTVGLFSDKLGQQFTLHFRTQEELSQWAMGRKDVKPYRIVRKNFPYGPDGDILEPSHDGDGVEFIVFGRPGKNEDSGFGRKVEVD